MIMHDPCVTGKVCPDTHDMIRLVTIGRDSLW